MIASQREKLKQKKKKKDQVQTKKRYIKYVLSKKGETNETFNLETKNIFKAVLKFRNNISRR